MKLEKLNEAENIKARYNPKYTAREVARDVKAEVDALIKELVGKYGVSVLKSATVMNVFKDEPYQALLELESHGNILSNSERWG